MNNHAKSSKKATVPRRTSKKRSNTQTDRFFGSNQQVVRLVHEIRTQQSEIELQNNQLRKAIGEIIKQRRDEDAFQKSEESLKKTIEDRTAELRNAYELLNSIFAGIDVHIAYLDTDLNFITVNQVYAAADNRSPDFYFGKNYVDVSPGGEDAAIFRDVIETGEPYYEYEKPIVSDRSVTYWDWSVQPVKGRGNTVNGLVLSMINVTDRKRAEESTIRMAAAIESTGDAVIITDVRGMIKYVNPAFEKTTGYSQQEALGQDKDILESGKQDEAFYRNVRETIRRQGSWMGRVIHRKKDGTLFTEECTWSMIRNQSGEIINYVSIGRDITEKLRFESTARSVNTDSVPPALRHEIAEHTNSIVRRLNRLKVKPDQMDKSDIERQVEGCLNEALQIKDLLKA